MSPILASWNSLKTGTLGELEKPFTTICHFIFSPLIFTFKNGTIAFNFKKASLLLLRHLLDRSLGFILPLLPRIAPPGDLPETFTAGAQEAVS